ncbi:caspase family protein [Methanolobus sp.]|uniref:caspase family protein n=1 Tax=Methanolobus sp. TaxID=1874737 RepID=UPI0025F6EF5E|nr:caspase family protein [Methanolobus sp.]
MGKIFLLSIGINDYPHFRNLDFCVADAELIYSNYSQFNCEFKKLLINENASKELILKNIHEIRERIRDEDYFILSFAGHGFAKSTDHEEINSKNSFICPYNFDPTSKVEITSISLFDLNEEINSLEAKSKLVFFDACHSGGALREISDEFNLRDLKVDDLFEIVGENEGTCIFAACDSHESALEYRDLGHGIFTHSLIESLKELGLHERSSPYEEVYGLVSTKVRTVTDNQQNPKVSSSDQEFKVITLPDSEDFTPDEIQIDTTIVPTSSLAKNYEYISPAKLTSIERNIIQLISEDRFIELDKSFKSFISLLYKRLLIPDVEYSAKTENAIPYYESCREYLKPLLLISDYDISYYNSRCLMNNLDYILDFKKLCRGKSGTTAIIEIPLHILAEYLFSIIATAYSKKDVNLLKKIINHQLDYHGLTAPIIYHINFWSLYMFPNVDEFLNYIYEPEWINQDVFNRKDIEDMNEICFLFDCHSSTDSYYHFYPTYFTFNDFDVLDRVISKLESGELNGFITSLFEIPANEFVKIIIQRLNNLATHYRGSRYFRLESIFHKAIERLNKIAPQ